MDRLPCEFFLIRYVPDVVKGEFVNIGVVLREVARNPATLNPASPARASVRFTRDWSRVRCMDAAADLDLLEALEADVAARLARGTTAHDPRAVLDTLADTLSNSVQITEPRATLAESLPAEMEQLLRLYVEPMKQPRTRAESAKTGRAALLAAMRTEWEHAGVWPLLRKRIPAAPYTRPGDPLRLDCGYRPESRTQHNTIKLFQAVSLASGDLEAAKGLAFSAPQLAEGIRRVEGAHLELSAVVEPLPALPTQTDAISGEDTAERYRFAVSILEDQHIRVLTTAGLARAAQTARHDLGL